MRDVLSFPVIEPPGNGDGTATQIADGVFWLRMPMGKMVDAINVWALADGDGWTIVDTGLRSEETLAAWRSAFSEALGERPIQRIIVTHLHQDHSGMAGWLSEQTSAPLWMTRLEYFTLRTMGLNSASDVPDETIRFYKTVGWNEEALDHYRERFKELGDILYPPPDSFCAMEDQQRLMIGGREWIVMIGRGHSPEHASLYCPQERLLISGDQVLPQISSNISVQPVEPEADPLSEWLSSLAKFRSDLPDDVLVLPAHGRPFFGLHARIDAIIKEHENRLDALLTKLAGRQRAIDVFPVLFKRDISMMMLELATGESLAHLACLRSRRLAVQELDPDGIRWWRAT